MSAPSHEKHIAEPEEMFGDRVARVSFAKGLFFGRESIPSAAQISRSRARRQTRRANRESQSLLPVRNRSRAHRPGGGYSRARPPGAWQSRLSWRLPSKKRRWNGHVPHRVLPVDGCFGGDTAAKTASLRETHITSTGPRADCLFLGTGSPNKKKIILSKSLDQPGKNGI